MKESIGIDKGEIILDDDHLEIFDGMKPSRKYRIVVMEAFGLVLAVLFLLRYFREGETWYLVVFAVMLAMGIPGSLISYRMCFDKLIKYRDIKVVRIKDNFAGQLVADFILKNRKKRQVILDQNKLSQFERTMLDHFSKVLKEKGLVVEIG